ncbi:UNVERIFIED_CONTAM: hypothetical protein GTU68_015948 [Idotea baltica]|nr:hypothetical protein [Idotea baltica]
MNFDLQLTSYDTSSKIKVIKEVRGILGLGLKEAKEVVESAPNTLKKGISKSEAQDLKEKLEKAGCKIDLL